MARDWRVDTLRGYFLVSMTLGHFPNPLARFTEYTFGYASSPDGFVFLSGLVSSWVYLALLEKRGDAAMTGKVWRRCGQIYLTHLALLSLGILFALSSGTQSFRAAHPHRALAMGSLLINQGGFDKILPMYFVFLACTPLVLRALRRGQAWIVVSMSLALWTASQFTLGDNTARLPWLDLGTFNLFAWQAYFIAGLCLGYRQMKSPANKNPRSGFWLAVCLVVAVVLFLDRHLLLFTGIPPIFEFSGHPDHNPVRFLDAAVLGYIVYCIPREVDLRLMRLKLFQFFNELGGHSLQVFAFSMVVTRAEAHVIPNLSLIVQLVLTLLTILGLIIPVRLHNRYRQFRSRKGPVRTVIGELTPA